MSDANLEALRSRFSRLLSAPLDDAGKNALFEAQNRVQETMFGRVPIYAETRSDVAADDPRLEFVLDALSAISLAEDDSAFPWMRAGVLHAVGRHLEAAADFLEAAARFEREFADGTGVTGDEDDWAATALYKAAENFVLGGQPLAAQALLPRLPGELRERAFSLIEEAATTA